MDDLDQAEYFVDVDTTADAGVTSWLRESNRDLAESFCLFTAGTLIRQQHRIAS